MCPHKLGESPCQPRGGPGTDAVPNASQELPGVDRRFALANLAAIMKVKV